MSLFQGFPCSARWSVLAGLALLAGASAQAAPLDVSGFIKEVDRNHDGCVTHAEWQRAGAPESAYQNLKDARGCVTLAVMSQGESPEGIDGNGDGKLTLAEFKAFDKKMATLMATMKQRAALGKAAAPAACDRACLQDLANRLIDSMVAHDTSALPLATTYAATENSVPAALNMMVAWRTVTAAPAAGRFFVIDATSQQVFLVVNVSEGASDMLLWGRLKAQDGRLAEVELYENRSRGQGGYQFGAGLVNFPVEWTAAVGPERVPARATLLRHGQSVFNTRVKNLPAAGSCVLMENGKVVEEHAEVAAEVAGGPAPQAGANGMVPIPCGMPPQRPTDAKARTGIVDEVQGIVVTQATVHGATQPMIITTPTESAFVPDQILAPYTAMLKKQQATGKYTLPALRPMAATAAAAEVHRVYDGQVQGQLLLVNIGAPGSYSPWVR